MPDFKDKIRIDDVLIKKATTKAVLCSIDGDDIWILLSQLDDDSEIWKEGDEGTLVISDWIAAQKGIK